MPVVLAVVAVAATAASAASTVKTNAAARDAQKKALANQEKALAGGAGQTAADERFDDLTSTLDIARFDLEQQRVKAENTALDESSTRKDALAYGGLTLTALLVLLVLWKAAKKMKFL